MLYVTSMTPCVMIASSRFIDKNQSWLHIPMQTGKEMLLLADQHRARFFNLDIVPSVAIGQAEINPLQPTPLKQNMRLR